MSDDPLALDRKALFAIVLVGLVLGPAAILATIWRLTDAPDFTDVTTFGCVASGLSSLLVVVIVRSVGRELAGAIGVRFDDTGVQRGRIRLAWTAITEVGSPSYGYLDLRDASGTTLRITTYLFRDRAGLLAHVGRKVGVVLRERTLSL